MPGNQTCQKPACSGPRANTYDGPHGNTIRVCDKHYYQLVTRGRSLSTPLGLATDEMRQEPVDDLDRATNRTVTPSEDILTGGSGEPY